MFSRRHIGPSDADQKRMLKTLGFKSLAALLDRALPETIRHPVYTGACPRPGLDEAGALAELRSIADKNRVHISLIGQGFYNTVTPAVIRRNILENPAWYTSYTPYQPEISQGRLEMLLNFQTLTTDLTGLDIANSSMLDEASVAAEAMLLLRRASRIKSSVFVVSRDLFPSTLAVLKTRAEAVGIELRLTDLTGPAALPSAGEYFGVILGYPAASGRVVGIESILARVNRDGALSVVVTDLLALTLIKSPGSMGADVACGSSQRLGIPLGFGGPSAAFLAVRKGLERQLPGRLVGLSKDANDYPAYRLTLQAREQHIRRERATSNICTAQVLLAVMSAAYACFHGPEGLRQIAASIAGLTQSFGRLLRQKGWGVQDLSVFDTLRIHAPKKAQELVQKAYDQGLLFYADGDDYIQLSFDELTARLDEPIVLGLARVFGLNPAEVLVLRDGDFCFGTDITRSEPFMEHPVFSAYACETALMRYLRRLADKDYALDRGLIPLGSCTMKLNAACELEPVSWPKLADLHPLAPAADTAGSREIIAQLQAWLADLTGYARVSLQPNAGSQGELAGLLAIRAYHHSRGEDGRRVCLIPQSAHGTNAASAVLAGLRVVIVACDAAGNIDMADLRARIGEHAGELAAIMITYPSTHGVYEDTVGQVCDLVHENGGQVYIDGANFNALLGFSQPGRFGGDVSHLNLHKTFAIPHGGGGPGVGPVACREHLAPFLPTASVIGDGLKTDGGQLTSAVFGSAGVLPISWMYIRLLGLDGLTRATGAAILAANYVAGELKDAYPVLYTGKGGLVAHECILDLRPLSLATGVTVDDVAKRLIDYGFHAPTMSFPVPGTLMVEPTESEPLSELDRFIAAMRSIRGEIEDIALGRIKLADSPLRRAPHTLKDLVEDPWDRAYSRRQAVFPARGGDRNKYWPSVARIDQAHGDRNLFCSCPDPAVFGDVD